LNQSKFGGTLATIISPDQQTPFTCKPIALLYIRLDRHVCMYKHIQVLGVMKQNVRLQQIFVERIRVGADSGRGFEPFTRVCVDVFAVETDGAVSLK
jgi:hypothetical protein